MCTSASSGLPLSSHIRFAQIAKLVVELFFFNISVCLYAKGGLSCNCCCEIKSAGELLVLHTHETGGYEWSTGRDSLRRRRGGSPGNGGLWGLETCLGRRGTCRTRRFLIPRASLFGATFRVSFPFSFSFLVIYATWHLPVCFKCTVIFFWTPKHQQLNYQSHVP